MNHDRFQIDGPQTFAEAEALRAQRQGSFLSFVLVVALMIVVAAIAYSLPRDLFFVEGPNQQVAVVEKIDEADTVQERAKAIANEEKLIDWVQEVTIEPGQVGVLTPGRDYETRNVAPKGVALSPNDPRMKELFEVLSAYDMNVEEVRVIGAGKYGVDPREWNFTILSGFDIDTEAETDGRDAAFWAESAWPDDEVNP